MDGLAAVVEEHRRGAPFSGAIFVFRAKRADRVKLIMWDGTGLCLFAKRLEQGAFRWPKIENGTMRLTPSQLAALIEGLDWSRVRARRLRPPPPRLAAPTGGLDWTRGREIEPPPPSAAQ